MRPSRPQYYSALDLPSIASNAVVWIDASDPTTVTLSGSNVVSVRDKSSNGYVFSNSTGFTYPNNTFDGGRPSFLCPNRSNPNGILGINSTLNIPQPFTVFAVGLCQLPTAVNRGVIVGTNNQPFADAGYSNSSGSFRPTLWLGSSGSVQVIQPTTGSYPTFFCIYEMSSTSSSFCSVNGSSATASAAATSSGGLVGVRIGGSTNQVYVGHLCEIIIFNYSISTLSSVLRRQIEAYLMWKWGMQTLASQTVHPYASIFPVFRPWIPTDFTGSPVINIEHWFDAADNATITASGTTLTTWSNKGERVRNVALTLSNAAPSSGTITTGSVQQQNGLNLIGAGSGILSADAQFNVNAARTRFFVARPTVNQASTTVVFLNQTGTANGRDTIVLDSANGGRPLEVAQNVAIKTMTTNPLPNQSNVLAMYSFQNGGLVATNRIAYNGSNLPLSISVAAGSYLNSLVSTQIGSNADIGEWISYNADLSNTQSAQVEGYLAWKWGLQDSLPANHLYKLYRPITFTFSPMNIPFCRLWLDAADTSQFTGGSTWGDKSTVNNPGINGIAGVSTMPTVTTWTNGLQAARFSALSKTSMKTTSNVFVSANLAYGMFMVARINEPVTSGTGFLLADNTGNRQIYITDTSFPVTLKSKYITTVERSLISVQQSEPFLFSATGIGTGVAHYPSINGTPLERSSNGSALASPYFFGSSNADSGYISADIGEILVYSNTVTTADRRIVEGYLAWKWGLQTKLPANHPYRAIKP